MKARIANGLIAVIAAAVLSAGCAVFEPGTVENAGAQYVTYKATAAIIDGQEARAQRVIEIAQEVQGHANGDTETTIAQLEDKARSLIDWRKLEAADAVLINSLITQAATRLREEVGEGLLKPEDKILVAGFFGWVEDAATLTLQNLQ